MIIHLSEPPADQERSTIYFPMVFGGLPVAALDPVAEMARLLTTDPRQQRRLTLHPHLATSALWRAHGLAMLIVMVLLPTSMSGEPGVGCHLTTMSEGTTSNP
jgi:hypothetical protein